MKKILLVYDYDLSFSDEDIKPIAGTQSAFIGLVRAFRDLGHHVTVLTKTSQKVYETNLIWLDFSDELNERFYDLIIVNVSPWLFEKFKQISVSKKILWIHNEAKYLLYWKRYKYILKYWPTIVFSGKYHRSTLPWFIPCPGKKIIFYGLNSNIFSIKKSNALSNSIKRIYFSSNPLRSLDWLIDVWVNKIQPKVPDAELHIFSGWKTYGNWGMKIKPRMDKILDQVLLHKDKNVVLREPVPKIELFEEMKSGHALFYRGDKSETFCLAVAEAQALGLPAVVCDIGSMKERVDNEITGFVVSDSKENFAEKCIQILTDDQLWLNFHMAAIEKYQNQSWINAAKQFLKILN